MMPARKEAAPRGATLDRACAATLIRVNKDEAGLGQIALKKRTVGTMPNKYHTTWILIADASRARIVKNEGPGLGIDAIGDQIYEQEHRKTSDIMADRPGRSFDSVGGGRHAMEYSADPERLDQREFARSLVSVLEDGLDKGAYQRLVVVAPPQMLGDLRAELTGRLKDAIHAEINKDLTHVPNGELAEHLEDVLTL